MFTNLSIPINQTPPPIRGGIVLAEYMSEFHNDVTARNLLDKLGVTEKLNRPGITEVLINRSGEMFTEDSSGFTRYESEVLTLDNLKQLGNVLCVFNGKALTVKNPIHSVTLPDGERGHIMMPPSCEDGTMVFRLPQTIVQPLQLERLSRYRPVCKTSATFPSTARLNGARQRRSKQTAVTSATYATK